jgi:hypothetical protein
MLSICSLPAYGKISIIFSEKVNKEALFLSEQNRRFGELIYPCLCS